jgi:lysozyme family protein
MDAFEKALAATLLHEGFFSNDPDDQGGATTYGITESTARAHGYTGDMKDFPAKTAEAIYRQDYWDKNSLDEIAEYYEPIAVKMFDIGVNMGVGQAGKFFQRTLNCLNRDQALYPDLKVDGVIGSKTIKALVKLGPEKKAVLKMLNALQGAKYIEICERVPRQKKFVRGWVNRIS